MNYYLLKIIFSFLILLSFAFVCLNANEADREISLPHPPANFSFSFTYFGDLDPNEIATIQNNIPANETPVTNDDYGVFSNSFESLESMERAHDGALLAIGNHVYKNLSCYFVATVTLGLSYFLSGWMDDGNVQNQIIF